jgi:hypothetical protein
MRRLLAFAALAVALALPRPAAAAVGCSLNDPDRDIRRLFPGATGYRTEFVSIAQLGGKPLAAKIESRLGEPLDPVYEALDVDYARYIVLKGDAVIGYVHGVNQKGKYGGMQIILATDLKGAILSLYYQKLSSPEAARFRSESFTGQFKGLKLSDFDLYRSADAALRAKSPVSRIEDPSEKNAEDYRATLRGVMKNLILLEVFGTARRGD